MKKLSNCLNQRVLVLGAGMSGINTAKLLARSGAKVLLSDNKPLRQRSPSDVFHPYNQRL